MVTRRAVLGGLGAGAFAPTLWAASGVASARDLIAQADLSGDVSFVVADRRTGLVLEEYNAAKLMAAASTTKAITSLYALEYLGRDYRFSTRIVATGPVQGGVVQGDLVLAGGADPTLDTDGLGVLAAKLGGAGIRGVTGRFMVWGGAIPYAAQIADDQPVHVGYNPAISGIVLNYNRVHFEWKRAGKGYELSMDARGEKFRPRAYTAQARLSNRKNPVYSYRDEGGKELWTVAAGALGKAGSRWLPVRHPDAYAGDVFQTLCRSHGINLPAPRPVSDFPGGQVVAAISSADLPTILRDMMRFSTNLTAEAVGMMASAARGAGAGLGQSGRAMSDWIEARAGIGGAGFFDHSGLNVRSRISAADMVQALRVVGAPMGVRGLMKPFDLRDDRGKKMNGGPLRIDAKTGTLDYVSTLAGYLTVPDGTELVFAIFTGDLARRKRMKESDSDKQASSAWVRRSKILQSRLLERWGALYG